MRNHCIQRLEQLAAADPRIMFITGDLGFSVIDNYAQRFPKQYLNVGVAEQNMIGVATGLALEGRVVFVYSIGNFPTLRCLEQIRNDALYHGANVKVISIGGGFSYGPLGFSHHATEDLSILRALPGVTVVAPTDLWEVGEATAAIAYTPGVCYLRLDKSHAATMPMSGETFALGKARVIREGSALTFIAAGGIMEEVINAAATLAQEGIEARILSLHTIKPIDRAAIVAAARETGGIVTVEENMIDGGLGSAVAEVCLDEGAVPAFFHRIGLRNEMCSVVGDQQYMRARCGVDAAAIVAAVQARVGQACRQASVAS